MIRFGVQPCLYTFLRMYSLQVCVNTFSRMYCSPACVYTYSRMYCEQHTQRDVPFYERLSILSPIGVHACKVIGMQVFGSTNALTFGLNEDFWMDILLYGCKLKVLRQNRVKVPALSPIRFEKGGREGRDSLSNGSPICKDIIRVVQLVDGVDWNARPLFTQLMNEQRHVKSRYAKYNLNKPEEKKKKDSKKKPEVIRGLAGIFTELEQPHAEDHHFILLKEFYNSLYNDYPDSFTDFYAIFGETILEYLPNNRPLEIFPKAFEFGGEYARNHPFFQRLSINLRHKVPEDTLARSIRKNEGSDKHIKGFMDTLSLLVSSHRGVDWVEVINDTLPVLKKKLREYLLAFPTSLSLSLSLSLARSLAHSTSLPPS